MPVSKKLRFILVLFLFTCSPQVEKLEINGRTYRLAFYDDFDGSELDIDKWQYRTDSKHWSTQLARNVEVRDGHLYLHLKNERSKGKDYTGAGIISMDAFKYGYYESRLKVPPGAGWHTSFWLAKYRNSVRGDSSITTLEIDILENNSNDRSGYMTNLHKWINGHVNIGEKHISAPGIDGDFIVVSCIYTPQHVKYYLNGEEVRSIDIEVLPQGPLNISLTAIASFLGGTEFVDHNQLPAVAVFDYVKFYEMVQ